MDIIVEIIKGYQSPNRSLFYLELNIDCESLFKQVPKTSQALTKQEQDEQNHFKTYQQEYIQKFKKMNISKFDYVTFNMNTLEKDKN